MFCLSNPMLRKGEFCPFTFFSFVITFYCCSENQSVEWVWFLIHNLWLKPFAFPLDGSFSLWKYINISFKSRFLNIRTAMCFFSFIVLGPRLQSLIFCCSKKFIFPPTICFFEQYQSFAPSIILILLQAQYRTYLASHFSKFSCLMIWTPLCQMTFSHCL